MARSARFGGFVVALALLFGACGSDGNKPAAVAASSSGSAPAATSGSDASSGSASGSEGAALVDACKLSESDVGSIVGFTVTKSVLDEQRQCEYDGAETCDVLAGNCQDAPIRSAVKTQVRPFFGGDAGAKIEADQLARDEGATAVEVSGVGDKAFIVDVDAEHTGLVVFSGTTELLVAMQAPAEEATSTRKDKLIALAKKLLS